jgi:hypothetical protein
MLGCGRRRHAPHPSGPDQGLIARHRPHRTPAQPGVFSFERIGMSGEHGHGGQRPKSIDMVRPCQVHRLVSAFAPVMAGLRCMHPPCLIATKAGTRGEQGRPLVDGLSCTASARPQSTRYPQDLHIKTGPMTEVCPGLSGEVNELGHRNTMPLDVQGTALQGHRAGWTAGCNHAPGQAVFAREADGFAERLQAVGRNEDCARLGETPVVVT